MTTPDTRPCPYCNGEIKTAAKLCRHCKQPVPEYRPPDIASLPLTERKYADLLVEKGLLAAEQLNQAIASRTNADVDLLKYLSGQGLITAAQIENVQSAGKTQVLGEARRLGGIAVEKMLINQEQLSEVLAELEGQDNPKRLPDVLVQKGYITKAQAGGLEGSTVQTTGKSATSSPLGGVVGEWKPTPNKLRMKPAVVLNAVFFGSFMMSELIDKLGLKLFRIPFGDREIISNLLIVAGVICAIGGIVFAAKLHYECWTCVPHTKAPFSPSKALWFIFVPGLNLYWVFETFPKLADCLNEAAGPAAPVKINRVLGLVLAILFVTAFGLELIALGVDEFAILAAMVAVAEFVVWILFYANVVKVADYVRSRI